MFRTGEILLGRQGALHSLNSELCQNGRVSRTDLLSGQRSPAEVGRDGCLDGPGNLIAAQGRERGRETFLPVVRLYQAGVAATPFPHRGHPLGSLPPFPPRPRLDRGTGLDPEVQKGLLHFPFVRRAELHLRKVDTSKQSNLVDEDHVRTSVGLPEVLLAVVRLPTRPLRPIPSARPPLLDGVPDSRTCGNGSRASRCGRSTACRSS